MRRFGLFGIYLWYLFILEEEGRTKEDDDDEGKQEEGIKGEKICDE